MYTRTAWSTNGYIDLNKRKWSCDSVVQDVAQDVLYRAERSAAATTMDQYQALADEVEKLKSRATKDIIAAVAEAYACYVENRDMTKMTEEEFEQEIKQLLFG